jgi:superfamily II DNA or RNA helicase
MSQTLPTTGFSNYGYSIQKRDLSTEATKKLIKELTIQPKVFGAPLYSQLPSFSAYRENSTKYFMPKYYGLRTFGAPTMLPSWSKIETALHLNFAGNLRPSQQAPVEAFQKATTKGSLLNHSQETKGDGMGGGGILVLPCGFGKTTIACYIMATKKVKTLVIVHMEFLMNQWLERIHQYLPDARVGKIQGEVMDVENKDIVLGMLKSLAEKDYPSSVFQGFGMLICDEVHHFSSRTFSQSLFKLSPKFTLGLSATPERLDGTSHLFMDFLGPILLQITEPGKHAFEIRKISFSHPDPEYNKVITDYLGNTQYSSMLSKISQFAPRNEFIMRVIQDYLKEDPNTQMMVMAHNLYPLDYMLARLPQVGVPSVGKYVGGAKEKKHLKTASEKQVILATYKMASEGLDIPTLSSMILTSSKKDIVQTIGRITRVVRPKYIVYDIVDTHPCFQNQWRLRRSYYRSQGFRILETTHQAYHSGWAMNQILHNDNDNDDNDDGDDDDTQTTKTPVCLIKF